MRLAPLSTVLMLITSLVAHTWSAVPDMTFPDLKQTGS